MRKNITIVMLFNIFFVFLTMFFFIYIDIFVLFLISPFIPLIFFESCKKKLLKNDNGNDLERQLKIKQEVRDDIYQSINYTKRRYKNDLINKNIMLLRDIERLKKRIDKAKIDENHKKELKDYLNKQSIKR